MASQTITGPDLQYTQDNKRCFAFSGTINVQAGTVSGLDFATGSGYILGSFYYQLDSSNLTAGQEVGDSVSINGVQVAIAKGGEPSGSGLNTRSTPYDLTLIIPPFSAVTVSLISTDSDAIPMGITFTGRVYEYLPVRN